jgi:ATP-dependent helicase/DNAse subunit B
MEQTFDVRSSILDRPIQLHSAWSTIDRIDTMPGGFVVLDYKSSTKKLDEPSVDVAGFSCSW